MSPLPADAPPRPAPPSPTWYDWRRWSLSFLAVSILAHLLFGVVATYLIVQVITPKKKSFAGAPAGAPNAPTRALEHKVSMARKQQTMSAPQAVKRVVTTGLSKVALPPMPTMKVDAPVVPMSMAGMGGVGTGLGGLGGGGGGGGGGMSFFGLRGGNQGLIGTFYDLKQTPSRQPTGMTPQKYAAEVTNFLRGWNAGVLAKYYKGPQVLNATQILTPSMPAAEGPAAFGLQKEVKPSLWLVHYKGNVTPTESGTYHFVGAGDDVMLVRFNNRLVLARDWDNPTFGVIQTNWRPQANFDYGYSNIPNGFAKGDAIEVSAGTSYPIEVLIGEQPGNLGFAALFVMKEGVEYQKDAKGNPIVPVFRLARGPLPPLKPGLSYPPHAEDGPLWRVAAPAEGGLFH